MGKTPEEKAEARAAKQAKREARIAELDAKIAEQNAKLERLDRMSGKKPEPGIYPEPESSTSSVYKVREGGRNGTVHFAGGAIVRTFRKVVGRDDTQTIPLHQVTGVHLDRRTIGADVVTVTVGPHSYEWKSPGAAAIADTINSRTMGL